MSQEHTPIASFCERHRLRISDFAKLAGNRSWPAAQSWHKGRTSPTIDDALRVVNGLRAKGVKASLNDFDPAVAA